MEVSDISFGMVMLLQISIGLSVNIFLLLFYAHVISTSHSLSSPNLILAHLAFANTIILLTGAIPDALSIWGLENFLSDVGCKFIIYSYRVARGLVICTTCLLSVFQAVTISPGTSRWAGVKAKLPKYVVPSCALSWVLNLVVDLTAPMDVTAPRNSSSVLIIFDLKYCTVVTMSSETALINAVMFSVWDLFFVGLMSSASGYMVFILHRHHRQVQHLHGPGRSPREMPEVQAAKRIVALVTLYVLLYGEQSIMLSVLLNMKEKSSLLVISHMVGSPAFSVVSPFLVIHSNRKMKGLWKRDSSGSKLDSS
ncbi:vomeronasal 1 receptor ornAnaV1R3012 [Ornithorhynchus anatinus]|uniref:Vomeronasal type-1 receptor n=1 Tax=Ornithorhynchus anatinus TaxID=9258 RepID=A0A6I8N3D8_ORNAN|nr:vomeronasal 1 receptor ornAnaV1R3012 [Ornithorhynchus anatinus]